jgi:putative tryptophan/tyrosine transport system substrate-binding protein
VDRRTLLAGSVALVAAPVDAVAQPAGRVYRIGFLGAASISAHGHLVDSFRQGLREHGYIEGRNVIIEYRWAEGNYERLAGLAAELVGLPVDLLVTHGTPGTLAAKRATSTIPIVMAISGDAVATELVASLARPGGNITGSTFFGPELIAKRLELLKEALPRASRLAALANADNASAPPALRALDSRARALKVDFQRVEVRGPGEFRDAFATMVRQRVDGVVVVDDAMIRNHVRALADLAAKHRLPSIGMRDYAEVGGLMAYAADERAIWRRAAFFVDKILNGARPGDVPIEQASRFELVINLKTAKALGLTIPQSVLARADEVIQ